VATGRSAADQSALTGESAPVDKRPGDEVYGGTLNGDGLLEIAVARPAQDATLARMTRIVEEAQARRAPSQARVYRFAAWYTPAVIGIAFAVAVGPWLAGAAFVPWLRRALVLLVIACPCALVISTPVSILAAVANAGRHGVLIKGGIFLEILASVRAFVFDKTGTLTRARPAVTEIVPAAGWTEAAVLELAASLESGSDHPVAHSLVERARARGLTLAAPHDFRALPGLGARGRVRGRELFLGGRRMMRELGAELPAGLAAEAERIEAAGASPVLLWDPEGAIGVLGMADQVRDQAAAAVRDLGAAGIEAVTMLTGDNARTAHAVAAAVGIADVRAGLLPQEKVQAVEELLARHRVVAMVGDGVNDAPALARSSLGIVMGAIGSDASLETGDIVLMSDDLSRLPFLVQLGRATVSVIRQNIAASVLVKSLFFLMTLSGWVNLWLAVASDLGVSLLVTLNGMRLFERGRIAAPLPHSNDEGACHDHDHGAHSH
ncbi:MAG: heavy metal translocating P-type ATPase, partial [Planctomycetes bacterium]|nr:heavy metal translocating P-type ATPase [Planctomycetota bacterium]